MSTEPPTASGSSSTLSRLVRRGRRRSSFQQRRLLCHPLPPSLDALDLSSSSSGVERPTLASLRVHVLAYLADLETRLSLLEAPVDLDFDFSFAAESIRAAGGQGVADARQWAHTAIERIQRIRADVCSHLPEFPFTLDGLPTPPSLEDVRAHLPDRPSLQLGDVRSRLPDMPAMPEFDFDFDFDLSNLRSRLENLSGHLDKLQNHLASASAHIPSGFADLDLMALQPSSVLSDLLDRILTSDRLYKMLPAEETVRDGLDALKTAAQEHANAINRALNGDVLISYSDLPHQWKNNPYVDTGYRFIPLERWPLIIHSILQPHNETLNIHTHLIPFFIWLLPLIPFVSKPASDIDFPELLFVSAALLCLLSSAVWHTMAGCAHAVSMEVCARVDYVGIGWLISASVGSVMWYAFVDHPAVRAFYIALSFATGLAGSVLPFMDWFNQREYKKYRILFFLTLAFTAIAPLTHLAFLFTPRRMLAYFLPVLPSLAAYLIGLAFYASHFPENLLGARASWRWLDWLGGGSHALWHAFIVLAISQHRAALAHLRAGI